MYVFPFKNWPKKQFLVNIPCKTHTKSGYGDNIIKMRMFCLSLQCLILDRFQNCRTKLLTA